MKDRGPWRAFRTLCWDRWGVETADPDLIKVGEEVVIPPNLTEQEARDRAADLNSQAA